MKNQVHLLIVIIFTAMAIEWSIANYPDFSWSNVDSATINDLKNRLKNRTPTRRRYCECSEVDEEDNRAICASNGALYENVCLFNCAKVRIPNLSEVDIADCGTHTFKEFKMKEFRSHY